MNDDKSYRIQVLVFVFLSESLEGSKKNPGMGLGEGC